VRWPTEAADVYRESMDAIGSKTALASFSLLRPQTDAAVPPREIDTPRSEMLIVHFKARNSLEGDL
jgi:hypothetical protein